MKALKFLFLLTTMLFTLFACEDKNDISNLPPATQIGANTFGCLINGELYKTSGFSPFGNNLYTIPGCNFGINSDNNMVSILGRFEHGPRNLYMYDMRIAFPYQGRKTGVYKENLTYQGFELDKDYDSKITITRFDENILSGTFQMKLTGNGVTDVITHGRFDIKNN